MAISNNDTSIKTEEPTAHLVRALANEVAIQNGRTVLVDVVVPYGVSPGNAFTALYNNQEYVITCPQDAQGGQLIKVELLLQPIALNNSATVQLPNMNNSATVQLPNMNNSATVQLTNKTATATVSDELLTRTRSGAKWLIVICLLNVMFAWSSLGFGGICALFVSFLLNLSASIIILVLFESSVYKLRISSLRHAYNLLFASCGFLSIGAVLCITETFIPYVWCWGGGYERYNDGYSYSFDYTLCSPIFQIFSGTAAAMAFGQISLCVHLMKSIKKVFLSVGQEACLCCPF